MSVIAGFQGGLGFGKVFNNERYVRHSDYESGGWGFESLRVCHLRLLINALPVSADILSDFLCRFVLYFRMCDHTSGPFQLFKQYPLRVKHQPTFRVKKRKPVGI